jgi:hypothetical protein
MIPLHRKQLCVIMDSQSTKGTPADLYRTFRFSNEGAAVNFRNFCRVGELMPFLSKVVNTGIVIFGQNQR